MRPLQILRAALLLALLAAPALSLLGHPVVAYAKSASMEPAIRLGDVFLINPFVQEPAAGDIIVYDSVLQGGALAVHRVVGGSPHGYETRGDANAVTDQDAGEPLVTPDRIRGRVATHGGDPLVVPRLGLLLLEARVAYRSLLIAADSQERLAAYVALAAGALALLLPEARRPRRARAPRSRDAGLRRAWRRVTPRRILARHVALASLLVLGLAVGAAVATSRQDVPLSVVVTSSPPAGQDRSAAPGGFVPREIEVFSLPLVPTAVVVEGLTPGARVTEAAFHVPRGSAHRTLVEEVAGEAHGLQKDLVRVTRYPGLLPADATLALHRALPGGPLLAIGAAAALVLAAAYRAIGAGDVPLPALARRTGARGRAP